MHYQFVGFILLIFFAVCLTAAAGLLYFLQKFIGDIEPAVACSQLQTGFGLSVEIRAAGEQEIVFLRQIANLTLF